MAVVLPLSLGNFGSKISRKCGLLFPEGKKMGKDVRKMLPSIVNSRRCLLTLLCEIFVLLKAFSAPAHLCLVVSFSAPSLLLVMSLEGTLKLNNWKLHRRKWRHRLWRHGLRRVPTSAIINFHQTPCQ